MASSAFMSKPLTEVLYIFLFALRGGWGASGLYFFALRAGFFN